MDPAAGMSKSTGFNCFRSGAAGKGKRVCRRVRLWVCLRVFLRVAIRDGKLSGETGEEFLHLALDARIVDVVFADVDEGERESADAGMLLYLTPQGTAVQPISLADAAPHKHAVDSMSAFLFRYGYHHLQWCNPIRDTNPEGFLEFLCGQCPVLQLQGILEYRAPLTKKGIHKYLMSQSLGFGKCQPVVCHHYYYF